MKRLSALLRCVLSNEFSYCSIPKHTNIRNLLHRIILVGETFAGFTQGEPCNPKNTAYIGPIKSLYPPYRIKCVDITKMGNNRTLSRDYLLSTADSLFADHMKLRTLTPIIFQFLPNVELIDLSGNEIRMIPRAMNRLTPHLKTYLLADNRIRIPPKGTLIRSNTLDTLMLSNNMIPRIHYWTFARLPKLRVLYLDGNCLTYVKPRMFENLRNLQFLHLGNNRLKVIPPKELMPPKLKIYIVKDNTALMKIK